MEKLELSYIAGWIVKLAASLENRLEVSQNVKIELLCYPVISFLGIYPRELKTSVHIEIWMQMFITVLFMTAKKLEQHKCQRTNEWVNKCGISL